MILDMLFVKDYEIRRDSFINLYFSFDRVSFVGYNDKIGILKKYDSYQILNERVTEIGEYHHEYKYIVSVCDNCYFIRAITNEDGLIYDILIYTVKDINYINRIFFPNVFIIPDSVKAYNKPVLRVDNNVNLIYMEKAFTEALGYEDWDYKNKCLNHLDYSAIDKRFIESFKEADFNGLYSFKRNDDKIALLYLDIKYVDGLYIIKEIVDKTNN